MDYAVSHDRTRSNWTNGHWGWNGLLAWFLWLVTPASLVFRQAYFSEMSTGFLMLLAWWYLLEWRDSATTGSLVIVSAAVGWGAITRPLTALAFGLPIIIYVLWQGWRRGKWKQLAVGAAVGAAILMLQPWQNLEVTGDWSLTPIRRYSEVYFPFDWMGFDTRDTAPLRELPLDMRQLGGESVRVHNAHTVEALPTILRDRVKWILHTTWGGWWVALAPLAAIALIGLSMQGWFALGTFVLIVVGYLLFAHPAEWVLYYMEAQEIVVMITAVGIWNFSQWVVRLQRRKSAIPAREAIVRGGIAVCAFMLVVAPFKTKFIGGVRDPVRALRQQQSAFRTMLAELPQPSVVFVRYSPSHDIHASLITNAPDLDKAHAWTVYDRGAENLDLLAEARGRTPYIFEEHTGILHLINPTTGDILNAGDESQSPSGGP